MAGFQGAGHANELFLFTVFLFSFPLGVLTLCGTDKKSWACLASGVLIAVMTGIGKRFESWVGVPHESLFYEAFWSLGLLLQGIGALGIVREGDALGDLFGASILKTSKSMLLCGTYLATIALFYADIPAATSIENATFIGAFGCVAAIALTAMHKRLQDAFVAHMHAVLRGGSSKCGNPALPAELRGTLDVLVQSRDEVLRWKVQQENRIAHLEELQAERRAVHERVMHDIRSPLAALNMAVVDLRGLDEDTRVLIRTAVGRIRDMAHELLASGRKARLGRRATPLASENVSRHLDAILSQKRSELRQHRALDLKLNVPSSERFVFCRLDAALFHSITSNLINNAVEAMAFVGSCEVHARSKHDGAAGSICEIVVADDGPGIPEPMLIKLLAGIPVSSKDDGNGIGLLSAKRAAEAWGGSFNIETAQGRGTRVLMRLPIVAPPDAYVTCLKIPKNSTVIIVDDEASIHQVWDRLFKTRVRSRDVQLVHCYNADEFGCAVQQACASTAVWTGLVDYELANSCGLDLIAKHGVAANCVLVTSHDGDAEIRERCDAASVKILPKIMAPYVPIDSVAKGSSTSQHQSGLVAAG